MFLGKSGGPLGSAEISIRKPQRDSTGELYIPIHYDFTNGRGPSLDENSALVKPFRNIFKDGKPPDEISFVFHQENENDYFVLGSFVMLWFEIQVHPLMQVHQGLSLFPCFPSRYYIK
jgi:hypothetical protein